MTSTHIQKILTDLYALDPALRQHEAKLVSLLEELLASKPEAPYDETFIAELRTTLLSKVSRPASPEARTSFFVNFFSMPKQWYALGGAAIVLVIAVVAVSQTKLPTSYSDLSTTAEITRVESNAFGRIALGDGMGSAPLGSPETISARPESAPTVSKEAVTSLTAPAATDMAVGMGGGTSAKMIAPAPYNYTYVYKGDPISLSDTTVDVYRRIKPGATGGNWSSTFGQFSFGGLDLSSFGGASLSNVSLVQNVDKGYIININAIEGVIDIYQNWERWYTPNQEYRPVTKDEMLSDQETLSIAAAFLAEHRVDMKRYGVPAVEKYGGDFRIMAGSAESATMPAYYPDTVTVVYPLLINGQKTVENGGQVVGLRVGISVRERKVVSAGQFVNHNFESSAYTAESDVDRILKVAQNGGISGPIYYYDMENVKQKELTLGTPERVLLHTWTQGDGSKPSSEVYVPALSFPILNQEDIPYYYNKAVVVPLVKEMLDEQGRNGSVPPAVPLMKAEPAVLPERQ